MKSERQEIGAQQASEWIVKGMRVAGSKAVENRRNWLQRRCANGPYDVCANGFMLIGKAGDLESASDQLSSNLGAEYDFKAYRRAVSTLTGASERLVSAISEAHFAQKLSASQIADLLLRDPRAILVATKA